MIRLESMTDDEYRAAMPESVAEYAVGQVRTGNWIKEGSLERAQRVFEKLLPEGVDTPGHHVLSIVDAGTSASVGLLWYMERDDRTLPSVFICELRVFEPYRRKGFATAAMTELEEYVRREHGARRILLHTFAHNRAARTLYERLGYGMTNVTMAKNVV